MTEPIRVLVVDDQELVRSSFHLLVDSAPGFAAVGGAGSGEEAIARTGGTTPHVVLMDVRMPGMDGIQATRAITGPNGFAGVRVLLLTTFDLDEYVYAGLSAGASGFLLKNAPPEEHLRGIRVVAAGESLLAPSVTRRLVERFAAAPPMSSVRRPEALAGITEREREVLRLVARGLSNAETAEYLHLSLATVKTHISALLHKVGARDRAQLVISAYEGGLVRPGDT